MASGQNAPKILILLIHGFSRKMQEILHRAIPEEILGICIAFCTMEHFAEYSDSYDVDADRTTVTKQKTDRNNVFGYLSIHSI